MRISIDNKIDDEENILLKKEAYIEFKYFIYIIN